MKIDVASFHFEDYLKIQLIDSISAAAQNLRLTFKQGSSKAINKHPSSKVNRTLIQLSGVINSQGILAKCNENIFLLAGKYLPRLGEMINGT